VSPFYSSLLSSLLFSLLSAMRDHIDQPKARKAHQADKTRAMVFILCDANNRPRFPRIRISRGRRPVSNLARNNRSGPSPRAMGIQA